MKLTTILLALLVGASAHGQAILRNTFTTNANTALGATSSSTYPIMIDTANGVPGPNGLFFSPHFRLAITNAFFGGNLSLNGRTNKLSIANDTLLLDGVAVGGSTSTNYYSTIITTNLTVINSATISNIVVTNVTVQNNLTVSNLYTVNGNHNTLIVTNALTLSAIKTNLLATDANGLVTTTKFGAGLTWTPSTQTLSASGGSVSTIVTPLAYSGTNITGFDCTTNNASFTLTLTNHCLFNAASFTGLPNTTTNLFFTLGLQQNNAGGWVPKFTNSLIAWADGNQPVIKTNANAVSYVYFHTHLFTNGMLVGSPNINVQ